jgi:hypothetical protein
MSAKDSSASAAIAAIASVVVALITSGALTRSVRRDVARLEALPVGTVVASMLNETQLNDASEGLWVLADGRNVARTDYSRLTGETQAPDMRGRFLRGMDPTGATDPDGRARHAGYPQSDAMQMHVHDERSLLVMGDHYQHSASPQGVMGHSANNQPAYESRPSGPPRSVSGADSVRTASETRPANIAVYFYLKVNADKS